MQIQEIETMPIGEKLDIALKAIELMNAGDEEGGSRLLRTAPMPAYLAKAAKDTIGVDFLINGGWNLSEAEATFGADWLTR